MVVSVVCVIGSFLRKVIEMFLDERNLAAVIRDKVLEGGAYVAPNDARAVARTVMEFLEIESSREKLTDRGWVECPKTHCNGPRDCVGTERGCHVCAPGLGCNCCDGLIPPDDQVEAAARAAFGDETFDHDGSSWFLSRQGLHTKQARAALVAAARKEKG